MIFIAVILMLVIFPIILHVYFHMQIPKREFHLNKLEEVIYNLKLCEIEYGLVKLNLICWMLVTLFLIDAKLLEIEVPQSVIGLWIIGTVICFYGLLKNERRERLTKRHIQKINHSFNQPI